MKSLPTAGQRLRHNIAKTWGVNTGSSILVYIVSTSILFFSAPPALSVGLIFAIPAIITFGLYAAVAILATFALMIGFRSEAAANKKLADLQTYAEEYYDQNLRNAKSTSFEAEFDFKSEFADSFQGDFSAFYNGDTAEHVKTAEERLCDILTKVMGYDITTKVNEQESVKKTINEMRLRSTNPFKMLGLGRFATEQEITKAFKKKSLKLHPDRHSNDTNYDDTPFKVLNEARTLVKDPEARQLTLAIMDDPEYNFMDTESFQNQLKSKLVSHPQSEMVAKEILKLSAEITTRQEMQNQGDMFNQFKTESSYSF